MTQSSRSTLCRRWPVLLCAACVIIFTGDAAAQQSFTEDFTTTTYRDPVYSTAAWDTLAGEVHLTPFIPSTSSTIAFASPVTRVLVSNDLAFVGTAGSGLQIYDVFDPTAPTFVGSFTSYPNVLDIAIVGKILIMTTGGADAVTINVSDPTTPVLNSVLPVGGTTGGVAVDGFRVFLATGLSGLVVFDIPTSTTATYVASSGVEDVIIDGDEAYLALANGTVEAVNITLPMSPVLDGSISVGTSTHGLALDGDHLFVAAGSDGLQIVDIAQPNAMTLTSSMALGGNAVDVSVSSDVAFVAAQTAGVHQIDISDLASPQETTSHSGGGSAESVYSNLGTLFVADGAAGLLVREWGLDAGIQVIAAYSPPSVGQHLEVRKNGDWLYLLNGSDLDVMDVSLPVAPAFKRTIAISGTPYSMDIAGDLACIVSLGTGGFDIYSLQDPSLPTFVGSAGVGPWPADDVLIVENRAYVVGSTSFQARMVIFDISDPTAPVVASDTSYPGISSFSGIAVRAEIAYLTTGGTGLRVSDVSDATAPVSLPSIPSTLALRDIVISGGYAYCAGGLSIFDLDAGTEVSATPLPPYIYTSIAKAANHVYLGGNSILTDVTLSTATSIGTYGAPFVGDGSALLVEGTRLFALGSVQKTLYVSDLVNPYWDPDRTTAASVPIDGANDVIAAYRLQSTGSGSYGITVSSNGWSPVGTYYQDTGGFEFLTTPGNDLVWNAFLQPSSRFDAVISSITIDWLLQAPKILSITDVPNDQGGWARLRFEPSAYDNVSPGSFAPIAGYNIHRRVSSSALAARVSEAGQPVQTPLSSLGDRGRSAELGELVSYEGRVFLRGTTALAKAGVQAMTAPPGLWEVVGTVFADQSAEYTVLVPTLADSSASASPTAYFVSAHATVPSQFYESSADSGFSVDNIAPGVPAGFSIAYAVDSNVLSWDPAPEPDFQFYRVYRGTDPGFSADPSSRVQETAVPNWTDTAPGSFSWFYKVSSVDHAGNESAAVAAGTTTDAPPSAIPVTLDLKPNVPNPFNPRTSIRFSLPAADRVHLTIFNAAGRTVRVLVNEELPAGVYARPWNGKDESGRAVASGTYFCRLETGAGVRTQKMSLVR